VLFWVQNLQKVIMWEVFSFAGKLKKCKFYSGLEPAANVAEK